MKLHVIENINQITTVMDTDLTENYIIRNAINVGIFIEGEVYLETGEFGETIREMRIIDGKLVGKEIWICNNATITAACVNPTGGYILHLIGGNKPGIVHFQQDAYGAGEINVIHATNMDNKPIGRYDINVFNDVVTYKVIISLDDYYEKECGWIDLVDGYRVNRSENVLNISNFNYIYTNGGLLFPDFNYTQDKIHINYNAYGHNLSNVHTKFREKLIKQSTLIKTVTFKIPAGFHGCGVVRDNVISGKHVVLYELHSNERDVINNHYLLAEIDPINDYTVKTKYLKLPTL